MKGWFFGKRKKITDVWPKTEGGEDVTPAYLTHTTDGDMQTQITVNLLEAYGIPVVTQYPNDGGFGKVVMGIAGGGVDLFVPETMLEQAKDILESEPVEEDQQDQGDADGDES